MMKIKVISQRKLSSECWLVQVWGFEVCTDCQYQNTEQRGGKQIHLKNKNALGYKVPLHDVRRNNEKHVYNNKNWNSQLCNRQES